MARQTASVTGPRIRDDWSRGERGARCASRGPPLFPATNSRTSTCWKRKASAPTTWRLLVGRSATSSAGPRSPAFLINERPVDVDGRPATRGTEGAACAPCSSVVPMRGLARDHRVARLLPRDSGRCRKSRTATPPRFPEYEFPLLRSRGFATLRAWLLPTKRCSRVLRTGVGQHSGSGRSHSCNTVRCSFA